MAVVALACVTLGDARGQNVANGKTLYRFYCQVCHSPDPSTAVPPFNLIMSAANNPGQITTAAGAYPSQMGFIPQILAPADIADLAAYIGTFLPAPATVALVEYYNVGQDHYFITSLAAEIADLDRGIHPGWVRTGYQFNALSSPTSGASAVCRFYIPPAQGDSHFYSASSEECAEVQATYPAFVLETPSAFFMDVPDPISGACSAQTVPIYRLWDNRADTNHRYTTNLQVRQQMQQAGWIAEGYGPAQVIMCSPQ